MNSRVHGFHKKSPEERRKIIKEKTDLSKEQMEKLKKFGTLKEEDSNSMIENVVSNHELPLGIATNLKVNGKDYLVPMVTEESSVVAACSYGAKLTRGGNGIKATSTPPVMIGQIQLNNMKDFKETKKKILENKDKIIKKANERDTKLIELGGGAKDLEVRNIDKEKSAVIHLLIDVRDAMGANTVNTMCESVSPLIEEITNAETNLRILSNLSDKRMVEAKAEIPFKKLEKEETTGKEVAKAIVDAYEFAEADPYRAATHNKGVMNGMDAVCIATGNDFRALEAGAHSYAAKNGYKPITEWRIEKEKLKGRIEVPIALGTVGGITSVHPIAETSLNILDVDSAQELAEVVGAVGLIQNLSALKALATEGIQKGHMKLHAKNIAKQAGARKEEIGKVARRMIEEDDISQKKAEKIIEKLS